MKIRDSVYCTILLFVCKMGETVGLLTHGNSVNVTDTNHGFPGHNVDLADMIQLLVNQTAEIESLKQQTAEIEHLKQQTANDRSTIQSLQNRVFLLEAELNELNISKLPTSQEFYMCLKGINQLTQNMAANEASDKNLTERFNAAFKTINDLKVQVRYASLSLLEVHSMREELNGSLLQLVEDRINNIHDHIANLSKRIGFTATLSSHSTTWNSGTLVFPVVITNVGNGYNPSTGVFTAPKAGEYVFFVNIVSESTNTVSVNIILNGLVQVASLAYSESSTPYNSGPNLAVLTLQKADRVWVKNNYGKGYYGSYHMTTFSGFLI